MSVSRFWHLISSGLLKFVILKRILLILLAALSLYYSQTETSCKGSLSKCSVLKRPPTGKALAFIGLFNNNTRYCLPISCRCFQFLSYFKYS